MTAPRPIRLVALDIGNTCVELHPERVAARLNHPLINSRFFIDQFDPDFEAFLTGKITRGEYLRRFGSHLTPPIPAETIAAALSSLIGPEIPGVADYVHRLQAEGARIVYFSDINRIHLQAFREVTKDHFASVTDAIFSDEVGALKPSETMFRAFEQRYGVPDLYLDDRDDLVAAANARGWHAVQAQAWFAAHPQ